MRADGLHVVVWGPMRPMRYARSRVSGPSDLLLLVAPGLSLLSFTIRCLFPWSECNACRLLSPRHWKVGKRTPEADFNFKTGPVPREITKMQQLIVWRCSGLVGDYFCFASRHA